MQPDGMLFLIGPNGRNFHQSVSVLDGQRNRSLNATCQCLWLSESANSRWGEIGVPGSATTSTQSANVCNIHPNVWFTLKQYFVDELPETQAFSRHILNCIGRILCQTARICCRDRLTQLLNTTLAYRNGNPRASGISCESIGSRLRMRSAHLRGSDSLAPEEQMTRAGGLGQSSRKIKPGLLKFIVRRSSATSFLWTACHCAAILQERASQILRPLPWPILNGNRCILSQIGASLLA